MADEEEIDFLWLSACSGLDYGTAVKLLRAAKNPENLFRTFETCAAPLIKERGLKAPTLAERTAQRDGFLEELAQKGCFAVTLLSDDYPEALKAIPAPPLVLYGMGRRELLRARKFCIVGSRKTPAHAERAAAELAGTLAKLFTIVTGLAEGGDRAAIEGALPNVISVLPCGLDQCYPASHASLKQRIAKEGLLLSEYPFGEGVRKYSFHARNRLLAGLSEGTLVVSAGERSGALITAGRTLDYGRDLFVFPYSLGISQGAGCNELLKRGAYVCTGAEDILANYGLTEKREAQADLSEAEEKILRILKEEGILHTETIALRAGVSVCEAAATLSALEIKGLAAKAGGNRYACV